MTNKPRLFISFGIKYEPSFLVDDLYENLSWADKFAPVDCRHRKTEFWIHEGQYRKLQRKALLDAGIQIWDWVLVTSPDERWETSAETYIRDVMIKGNSSIYSFPLKEMFTPTQYRTDGIWGKKTRPRLYPFLPNQNFSLRKIQSSPVPVGPGYRRDFIEEVNLYHLKNIEPQNRVNRALAYEALDPTYKFQKRDALSFKKLDKEGRFEKSGYHYLYETDDMELEDIPKGREFYPPYTKPYYFEPF